MIPFLIIMQLFIGSSHDTQFYIVAAQRGPDTYILATLPEGKPEPGTSLCVWWTWNDSGRERDRQCWVPKVEKGKVSAEPFQQLRWLGFRYRDLDVSLHGSYRVVTSEGVRIHEAHPKLNPEDCLRKNGCNILDEDRSCLEGDTCP